MELLGRIFDAPLFGLTITLLAYQIGVFLNQKFRLPLLNPLLIADCILIPFIAFTPYELDAYLASTNTLDLLLIPATASLALSIYDNLDTLKQNFLPVLAGCLAGSLTSIFSTIGLCRLLGIDTGITASLFPKSVTTPIAMELAESAGGVAAIAVAGVLITGLTGAVLAPVLIKAFRVEDPVAQGVGMGTSAHALGTIQAIKMGELQGAMSGLSIGIAGMWTVLIALFIRI